MCIVCKCRLLTDRKDPLCIVCKYRLPTERKDHLYITYKCRLLTDRKEHSYIVYKYRKDHLYIVYEYRKDHLYIVYKCRLPTDRKGRFFAESSVSVVNMRTSAGVRPVFLPSIVPLCQTSVTVVCLLSLKVVLPTVKVIYRLELYP